jgi:hypothetical protein
MFSALQEDGDFLIHPCCWCCWCFNIPQSSINGGRPEPRSVSLYTAPLFAIDNQPTEKLKRKKVVVVVCQCCTVFEKNYTTVRGKAQSQFACTHRPRYFFHQLPTAPSRTDTQEESEKRRVVFYQMWKIYSHIINNYFQREKIKGLGVERICDDRSPLVL